MNYKLRRLTALMATVVMMLPTSVYGASSLSSDIYVGDVVSISAADLQVKSDYKSMDEVTKEYTQDMEKISSNGTSIDSSDGKLNTGSGNTIIDGLIKNIDFSGTLPNKKKATMSYEDFLKLSGEQNSKIKEKYEKAKQNAKDQQTKANKKAAEKLRKALEEALKGKNPVTGKDAKEGENFYEDMRNAGEDFLDWVRSSSKENADRIAGKDQTGNSGYDNSYYDGILKHVQDEYKLQAKNGDQSKIKDLERLDKSEFLNDTLVYSIEKENYQDIKYKCSKCGKVYGFNEFCDCGKILGNNLQKFCYDNKSMTQMAFGYFIEEKQKDMNGVQKFFDNLSHAEIKCGICGKSFDMKVAMPEYMYSEEYGCHLYSSGNVICNKCYNQYKPKNEGTEYKDTSNWATAPDILDQIFGSQDKNTYVDDFIIPCISKTMAKKKADDDIIKEYLDMVPEDEKKAFNKIEEERKNNKSFAQKQEEALDKFMKDFYDWIKSEMDKAGNEMPDGSSSTWTDEEVENVRNAIQQLEAGGIPNTDGYSDNVKKIMDSEAYKEDINKIFMTWNAEKSKWTTAQKDLYDRTYEMWKNDTGIQDTLKDMIDKGIISKDKTPDQILKGVDDYIASFTSINESVTVNVTVDSVGGENHTNKKNYTVQGDILLSILNPSSKALVSDYQITDSIAYRFCPDTPGKYTMKRKVRIYDIEWQVVYQNYDVKVEVEMPDGTTELLTEKQITRVKEDKSGLKSSNMRELSAPDITVNVKPRTLDIDKKDFYDTERVS